MARDPFYYIDRGDLAGLIAALEDADINIRDIEGQSLLHSAAGKVGYAAIAEELVRRGIDANIQDNRGRTPLQFAAVWKRTDVAQIILNAGGRLEISDEHGNQALWYAVNNPCPDFDLINAFLHRGADPLHRNKYGKSPLDIARKRSMEPLVRVLTGEASPQNRGGRTGEKRG